MQVQFLRDFQGVSSRERYYTAGTVVDLPGDVVHDLLLEQVVTVVDVPPQDQPATVAVLPPTATVPAAPDKPRRGGKRSK